MVDRFADLRDGMTEAEIMKKFSTFMSDELKAEFIENCLKKKLDSSVKKNIHIKVADIYDRKKWYTNAASHISAAISCTDIYREKMGLFMKLGQLNIKDNKHIMARDAFKSAMDYANSGEKKKISDDIKNLYLSGASSLDANGKWTKAALIYEYSLDLLTDAEKKAVKQKLVILYEKLGRVKDSMRMKKEIMYSQNEKYFCFAYYFWMLAGYWRIWL